MKCDYCSGDVTNDDYCICTKCHKTLCPACAEKSCFVCDECGGAVAYLS